MKRKECMKKFLLLTSLSLLLISPVFLLNNEEPMMVKGDIEEGILKDGEYFITSNSSYEYGLDSRDQGTTYPRNTSQSNITAPFTFTHVGNNKYTISSNTNYLYYRGNAFTQVSMVRVNSAYESTYANQWSISLNGDGTYNLSLFGEYNLFFETSSKYWGISKSTSTSKDMKIKLISVDEFYDTFNTNVTCDNGVTPPSVSGWNDTSLYLSERPYGVGLLKYLKTASNDTLNKYDYIVGKYGEDKYTNFLSRTITPINGNVSISTIINGDNNINTTLIVIISISSVATISFLVIKKKKEL